MKKSDLKTGIFFKVVVGLALIISFGACDPARMLALKNETGKVIELQIEFGECENEFITELSESKELENITLGVSEDENIEFFNLGMGGWYETDLIALIECTKSINIKEAGKPIRKIEGAELKKILPEVKKNIAKNLIIITIN
jgi:pectate lyase